MAILSAGIKSRSAPTRITRWRIALRKRIPALRSLAQKPHSHIGRMDPSSHQRASPCLHLQTLKYHPRWRARTERRTFHSPRKLRRCSVGGDFNSTPTDDPINIWAASVQAEVICPHEPHQIEWPAMYRLVQRNISVVPESLQIRSPQPPYRSPNSAPDPEDQSPDHVTPSQSTSLPSNGKTSLTIIGTKPTGYIPQLTRKHRTPSTHIGKVHKAGSHAHFCEPTKRPF